MVGIVFCVFMQLTSSMQLSSMQLRDTICTLLFQRVTDDLRVDYPECITPAILHQGTFRDFLDNCCKVGEYGRGDSTEDCMENLRSLVHSCNI